MFLLGLRQKVQVQIEGLGREIRFRLRVYYRMCSLTIECYYRMCSLRQRDQVQIEGLVQCKMYRYAIVQLLGTLVCEQGSFAILQGSFAILQGSFAILQVSFARVQVSVKCTAMRLSSCYLTQKSFAYIHLYKYCSVSI